MEAPKAVADRELDIKRSEELAIFLYRIHHGWSQITYSVLEL